MHSKIHCPESPESRAFPSKKRSCGRGEYRGGGGKFSLIGQQYLPVIEAPLLDAKLLAKINLTHSLIAQDRLSIALGDYLTFADNIGLLADIQCFPDVVVSQ